MKIEPLVGRMWEVSTGYTLWATKDRENQKSYSLYVLKPNSFVYEKIGLINDLESFANVFKVDID